MSSDELGRWNVRAVMAGRTRLEIRRRQELPIVVVHLEDSFRGMEHLLAFAARQQWRLVDLRFRRGNLPEGVVVKGAVITALPTDENVRDIMRLGCPVVRIGRFPHPMDGQVPAVIQDMSSSGRLAAEHFAERGFQHVGYVGHKPWHEDSFRLLFEAFRLRATELGCTCHLLALQPTPGQADRKRYGDYKRQVAAWLGTVPTPLGVLGYGDHWAAQLCSMCADAGFSVPEQVAILGRENDPTVVNACLPTLSSLVPDHERIAAAAVDMLQRLMDGGIQAETTVCVPPTGIIMRGSTDIQAVGDPLVARAMRFIWTHYELHISVNDVARETGVLRYRLERLFRQHLQRGINAELVRKRLDELTRLLRTTGEPITELSQRCGFRTMANLHKAFRQAYGMSPREYRSLERG